MLPREKIKDMCLQDAISYILRSHLMENSGVFFLDFLIEKTLDQRRNRAPREHATDECKPCTNSKQSSAFPHRKLPQSYARIPKEKNS